MQPGEKGVARFKEGKRGFRKTKWLLWQKYDDSESKRQLLGLLLPGQEPWERSVRNGCLGHGSRHEDGSPGSGSLRFFRSAVL